MVNQIIERFETNIFEFPFAVNLKNPSYSTKAAQSVNDPPKNEANQSKTPEKTVSIPPNSRFVYPEFLPDPNMKYRNPIREKLEREDMLNRR